MKQNPEGSWIAVGIFGAVCVGIGWVLAKETQKSADNNSGSIPGNKGFIPGGLINAGGKLNTAGIAKATENLANFADKQVSKWLIVAQELQAQAEDIKLTQAQKDELIARSEGLKKLAADVVNSTEVVQ